MSINIPLPSGEELLIPPREAVVANRTWISSIVIRTPSPLQEGSIVLEYHPWTGDRKDHPIRFTPDGKETTKVVELPRMYAALPGCPALKKIFDTLLENIEAVREYVVKTTPVHPSEIRTDDPIGSEEIIVSM
jgi:hypothetical protein